MATKRAAELSVAALERMIAHGARGWHRPGDLAAARAELAALTEVAGQVGPLRAALAALLNGGRWSDGYGARKYELRLTGDEHAALHDLLAGDGGPGAARARDETAVKALRQVVDCACGGLGELCLVCQEAIGDALRAGGATMRGETALLDAAARYQDAWRVLAAGDATEEAKLAHILDMHEAREDLFDAVEVALRAGGAGDQ